MKSSKKNIKFREMKGQMHRLFGIYKARQHTDQNIGSKKQTLKIQTYNESEKHILYKIDENDTKTK